MEIVHRYPTVVLDGAHNPHAVRALIPTVNEAFGDAEIVLVVACFADKDVVGILTALRDRVAHVVVTTVENPRAMDTETLHAIALDVWQNTAVPVSSSRNATEALAHAQAVALDGAVIVVTGSLSLVGEVRAGYVGAIDDDDTIVILPEDDLPSGDTFVAE